MGVDQLRHCVRPLELVRIRRDAELLQLVEVGAPLADLFRLCLGHRGHYGFSSLLLFVGHSLSRATTARSGKITKGHNDRLTLC